MLPKFLKPIRINLNSLVRLGMNYDGGYVISKKTLEYTKTIITFGLNDDWSFEKDFIRLRPKVKVVAFDHTVTPIFWCKRFLKDIFHFVLLKKLSLKKIKNLFKFIDYKIFFSKNKHYVKKIGNSSGEINLKKILEKKFDKFSVFLKVDIEGDEYKILNSIRSYSNLINSLVIEFHHIQKKQNLNLLKNFVQNSDFKIIHIHANNCSYPTTNGIPSYLELTFVNCKKIKCDKGNSKYLYPIKGLDYPNIPRLKDIKLNFKKNNKY